jgi:hypothetical protein
MLKGKAILRSITKRTAALAALLAIAAACAQAQSAQAQGAQATKTVDQILTLVNNEVITRTDLLWHLALAPDTPSPAGQVGSDLLRRLLDVMIDQRLVAQEAAKLPTPDITEEEVEKKRLDLIKEFPSEAAFRQRVESVGLTPERISELMRQRVLIDKFIDFRFRSFVFVSEQEIKRYYDERLVPEVRNRGVVPPSLDQVHEQIRETLRAEKINNELDHWLSQTRQRAEIVHLAEP